MKLLELNEETDASRIRYIEYQRARYAQVKKKEAEERASRFLRQYPDWETKKQLLTSQELFLINQFYGLTPPRMSGGKLAKLIKCTPQYIYKRIRIAEAKLRGN